MIMENIITPERINLPELEFVCKGNVQWLCWIFLLKRTDPAGRSVGGDADKSLHGNPDGGVDRDGEEDLGDGKEPGDDVR